MSKHSREQLDDADECDELLPEAKKQCLSEESARNTRLIRSGNFVQ